MVIVMVKLVKVYQKNSKFLIPFVFLFTLLVLFIVKKYFNPSVLIVPHHDFVKQQRAEFFTKIKFLKSNYKEVIVIGPDHFSHYQDQVFYSDQTWYFDQKSIEFQPNYTNLLNNLDIHLYNSLVQKDHTVMALIPDIITNFPEAKIVPILIGQKVNQDKLDQIVSLLNNQCQKNCLLITSVDFSHYLPYMLADIHDQTSQTALQNLDLNKILKLEVDSPQSLYIATKFAKLKRTLSFNLENHTNSGKIANNPNLESTSHFFGYFSKNFLIKKHANASTFLYTPGISPSSKKLLGDRFFYGTDEINFNFNQNSLKKLNLPLIFDPYVFIAGSVVGKEYHLVILPFTYEEGLPVLLTGDEKSQALSTYFKKINTNDFISFSLKDGTLFYVQETN